MNLLSVQGLQASYGPAQVLFDISFEVPKGQAISLLGRNGMGRSTTVKCLFGLLAVQAGSVMFEGQSCQGLPSYRLARLGLGLVPEGRQVFPNLTVEENLRATARKGDLGSSGLRPWQLERVYAFFPRLAQRRRNMGSQLSGGEQQMLAIARALMTNPRLLVLDEATEGLSPALRHEVWSSLAALRAEGLSMIIIDKHLDSLERLVDHHYMLEKGRVVWQGNTQALRAHPDVVQRYLGV